jgi:hypothetical protein
MIASLAAAFPLAVLSWLIVSGEWDLFGIWKLDSVIGWETGFGDLAFITGVAECFNQGELNLDTCDPYGRPYSPYGLIPGTFLSWFGLGISHTGVIGSALAGIWVVLVFWLTYRISRQWTRSGRELTVAIFALVLFAISPTVLLAVERGSLDILVTAFGALGLVGFTSSNKAKQSVSAAFLFLAVALKYFAVGIFAPFFAPRKWSLIGITGAIVTAGFMTLNLANLRLASEIAGTGGLSTSRLSFSNTTGLVTILVKDPLAFAAPEDSDLSGFTLRIISFVLLTLLVIALLALLRSFRGGVEQSMPTESWLLIIGGSFAILLPYLIGSSYDYRLVVLLIPLVGFIQWLRNAENKKLRITLWVMIALTVVVGLTNASMSPNDFGFYLPKLLVVFGDVALATVLAFSAALFINAWLPKRPP